MTTKKKATTGTGSARKLKLKKETIRDLDVKGRVKDVQGGRGIGAGTDLVCVTLTCRSCLICK